MDASKHTQPDLDPIVRDRIISVLKEDQKIILQLKEQHKKVVSQLQAENKALKKQIAKLKAEALASTLSVPSPRASLHPASQAISFTLQSPLSKPTPPLSPMLYPPAPRITHPVVGSPRPELQTSGTKPYRCLKEQHIGTRGSRTADIDRNAHERHSDIDIDIQPPKAVHTTHRDTVPSRADRSDRRAEISRLADAYRSRIARMASHSHSRHIQKQGIFSEIPSEMEESVDVQVKSEQKASAFQLLDKFSL
eukprot:gnl/Dysnectes_brevis/8425_a14953_277.p1 GENE.gnl/Dysnectes_brevis/8425_a14953_277~~gnl/Dysnectes_brevis/8425_a14953_277.p1  ORF type:complete len:251 (+),score=-4.70 gnl/Dysnectes_brevis/8425_a14953_277:158-910(+)